MPEPAVAVAASQMNFAAILQGRVRKEISLFFGLLNVSSLWGLTTYIKTRNCKKSKGQKTNKIKLAYKSKLVWHE